MDYKVEVKGQTKIYHTNLKNYVKRDEDTAGVAVQVDLYKTGVAVLDKEPGWRWSERRECNGVGAIAWQKRYTDVNISENLTYQQGRDIQDLVQEYSDIFT